MATDLPAGIDEWRIQLLEKQADQPHAGSDWGDQAYWNYRTMIYKLRPM
jgi:hypothetical protein